MYLNKGNSVKFENPRRGIVLTCPPTFLAHNGGVLFFSNFVTNEYTFVRPFVTFFFSQDYTL